MLKFIVLTLAAAWMLPLAVGAEPPLLRLGAPESQRPFGQLVEAVIRDAGIEPVSEFFPAARSRQQFIDGEIDAEFFRSHSVLTAGYPGDTITIGPLVRGRIMRFGRQGSHKIDHPKVGHIRGNVVIERYVAEHRLDAIAATGREVLYRLLDSGRVDQVIDEERFALIYLGKADMHSRIRTLGKPVLDESGYLLLNPKKRELEERLRRAFEQWHRDGRWEKSLRAVNLAEGLPAETSLLAGPSASSAAERRH